MKPKDTSPQKPSVELSPRLLLLCSGLGVLVLIWAYWDPWSHASTMGKIVHNWEHTPVYSHGYLIPVFAIGLLWYRRERIQFREWSPSWWGLVLLGLGIALRLAGARYYMEWFDFVSILPMLAGMCLLIGGTHALRWAAPAILFLIFMLPLPYRIEIGLRTPLQKVGTIASCYLLQTLGFPAYAEGNQIHGITEQPLGVEEACSGLGMMMVFFALTAAVVYVVSNRPLWERALVVLSAAPIAVISNVLRISATGLLYAWGYDRAAEILHEQLSAFLMMPVALGLLWLELWFFSRIMVEEDSQPLSAHLMFEHAKKSSKESVPLTSGS